MVFDAQTFLISLRSSFSLLFYCLCFWCWNQEIVAKSNVMKLFLGFLLRLRALGVTFRQFIHLNYILYTVWGKGPSSFFPVWTSHFPSSVCWKDCPFPIKGLGCLVRHQLTTHVRVSFWTVFHTISLYICPYASTTLFSHHNFVLSLESGTMRIDET